MARRLCGHIKPYPEGGFILTGLTFKMYSAVTARRQQRQPKLSGRRDSEPLPDKDHR